jgi:dsDNA-specific endonuclease/ATPase MutS2
MELDYHELGILTKEEIEYHLLSFIEQAHLAREDEVRIVTGKGRVVRPLVQAALKRNKLVDSFRFADYYSGQDGVIVVTLK